MKIINIVDSLAKVNFGIWNSAVSTAQILKETYNVESELWYPKPTENLPDAAAFNSCTLREIGNFNPQDVLTDDCILVSHGCWQIPTRLAYKLHKQFGTPWMYVPHGMLEPNSMKQKYLIKKIFFHLREKPLTKNANLVRAVSVPEQSRLEKSYSKVVHIANGVTLTDCVTVTKNRRQYLFMARIHKQKGIIELVQAWKRSSLSSQVACSLVIVGPDNGELVTVEREISTCKNVVYLGAKYGMEKKQILAESQFYVLPSKTEGFPTSVVEAMQCGQIPIISENCNFPECLNENIGLHTGTDCVSILETLEKSLSLTDKQIDDMSVRSIQFINNNYLLTHVAEKQYQSFTLLLKK